MTTIAITGVDGVLGRRLVAALDRRPDVTRVVGIDRRAPHGLSSPKLAFRLTDVRDPAVAEAFAGVDTLIHLADRAEPGRNDELVRTIDAEGTRTVFEAAAVAGVGHVVYRSSVLAYGAHPDNDFPLTESSPLRGIEAFELAEQERDVERWVWSFAQEHPELDLAVLRLAALLGPDVDSYLTRAFEAPRIPVVKGHRPPMQFLHADDAAAALLHAADHRLTGAYNVASEGWLSLDEVAAIVGRGTVEVPEEVAYSSVERLWALGLGDQPPGIVALFMHPCVMDASAFVATGWRPTHTNRDAVAAMASGHAPYLTLGTLRTRRSTVRWVAGGGVALLALVLVRAVRSLRRRRR